MRDDISWQILSGLTTDDQAVIDGTAGLAINNKRRFNIGTPKAIVTTGTPIEAPQQA